MFTDTLTAYYSMKYGQKETAGEVEIFRLLLDHSSDSKALANSMIEIPLENAHYNHLTALIQACCGGNLEISKLLCQYGADIHFVCEMVSE